MSNGVDATLKPRLCHVIKWPDFNGYGFNLHAEKGKAGQYIGKVDEDSPASAAGLKTGDRIVEIEGTNIGNENHQQVVGRIRAAGEEVHLLVVDQETDQYYKEEKKVVKGDLEEVVYISTPKRDVQDEEPIKEEHTQEVEEPAPHIPEPEPEPEPAPIENDVHVTTDATSNDVDSTYRIRLCHMVKRADFQGYGFNLHAERDKPGQYIGKIDEDSPAFYADLREGDRIVEVNDENIESKGHQEVISMIKSGGEETKMLVVDHEADAYYSSKNITVNHDMATVDYKCSRGSGGMLGQTEDIELPPSKPEFGLQDDEYNEVATHDEVPPEPVQDEIAAETAAVAEELPPPPSDDWPEVAVTDTAEPDVEAEFQVPVDDPIIDDVYVHSQIDEPQQVTENGETVEFTQISEIVENTETSLPDADETRAESPQEPEQVVPEPEPEPVVTEQEDTPKTVNGQASYVENTQNEVTSVPEPTPEPIPQKQTNGDILVLSAKEYRERLSTKKKSDPRGAKMDFRSKYDMFQQM